MLKDKAKKQEEAKNKKNKKRGASVPDAMEEDVDFDLHFMDLTLSELELRMVGTLSCLEALGFL